MASPQMQRYLARRARKAERRRLRFKDEATLIRSIVIVLREAREDGRATTHFTYEGMLTAMLRAELCLRSVPWAVANDAARNVVGEALRALGAKRPSWQEGQPEWTDGGVIRDTRVTCANCQRPLPEERKVYCSKLCGDAMLARRYWQDQSEEKRVYKNLMRKRRKHATGR